MLLMLLLGPRTVLQKPGMRNGSSASHGPTRFRPHICGLQRMSLDSLHALGAHPGLKLAHHAAHRCLLLMFQECKVLC